MALLISISSTTMIDLHNTYSYIFFNIFDEFCISCYNLRHTHIKCIDDGTETCDPRLDDTVPILTDPVTGTRRQEWSVDAFNMLMNPFETMQNMFMTNSILLPWTINSDSWNDKHYGLIMYNTDEHSDDKLVHKCYKHPDIEYYLINAFKKMPIFDGHRLMIMPRALHLTYHNIIRRLPIMDYVYDDELYRTLFPHKDVVIGYDTNITFIPANPTEEPIFCDFGFIDIVRIVERFIIRRLIGQLKVREFDEWKLRIFAYKWITGRNGSELLRKFAELEASEEEKLKLSTIDYTFPDYLEIKKIKRVFDEILSLPLVHNTGKPIVIGWLNCVPYIAQDDVNREHYVIQKKTQNSLEEVFKDECIDLSEIIHKFVYRHKPVPDEINKINEQIEQAEQNKEQAEKLIESIRSKSYFDFIDRMNEYLKM